MKKIKIGKNQFSKILAEFTENLCRESEYRSIIEIKPGNQIGSKKLEFEILILNMFSITWVCQNKKFPRELLDIYHANMYEKIRHVFPDTEMGFSKFGDATIQLPQETLLAAFEQEWLNKRYKTYYEAVKKLESDSGAWEIGKIVVKNLGGNVDNPVPVLKASSHFIISLKCISDYLDNFDVAEEVEE